MPIDTSSIQQDLCTEQNLIHFNSAGASLMPKPVLDCQIQHLLLEAQIGGYEAAREKATAITAIYSSVATLINCEENEVALVENATIGWFSAFYSIDFKAGDKILPSESEYGSNYMSYLQLAREKEVVIEVIPSNSDGEVCVIALQKMLDKFVKLIAITHIPTNGGLVNPIIEIGKIAAANNILYLVDACQSVGQLPVDVKEIQCDFLSATSRKYLRGPRGAGFLYVRKAITKRLNPPLIDVRSATWCEIDSYQLRDDAKRFENWENNYAALLGMGCAIDYALHIGIDNIAAYNTILARYLRQSLAKLDGISLWDIGREQCAIVTFSMRGIESALVQTLLQKHDINVSCSQPSSTLIDAKIRKLPDLVRASVHYFNNYSQIDKLINVLKQFCHPTP